MFGFLPNLGVTELVIMSVVALVILGPKKFPELGSSLGRGIREFKSAIGGAKSEAWEGKSTEENK